LPLTTAAANLGELELLYRILQRRYSRGDCRMSEVVVLALVSPAYGRPSVRPAGSTNSESHPV